MHSLLSQGLAGIQAVDIPGIENVGFLFPIIFFTRLCDSCLYGFYPILMILPLAVQVDVTHFIEGHSSYLGKTTQILEQLELDSYCPIFSSTHSKLGRVLLI